MNVARLTQEIKTAAWALGFDRVGVSDAAPLREAEQVIQQRLTEGHMDGLPWFTPQRVRLSTRPPELLPGARSILALAASYVGQREPPPVEPGRPRGRIARYAWGRDYHDVLKELARELLVAVVRIAGRPVAGRVFVDSSPLAERAVAQRAGIGWFGKNTMLLLPGAGSYSLLCEVVLDVELQPDAPVKKSCGGCTRCLAACPTGALVAPGVLHTPRCISFLTIELKDRIPYELRRLMGDWVFGCDLCQEVCPVNRQALPARIAALRVYDDEMAFPQLLPLLDLSEPEFRARYRGSAVLRAKRWGVQRNACVALGNLRDPVAIPALAGILSAGGEWHPLVREHAAWALGQFDEPAARRALASARDDAAEDAGLRQALERALAGLDRVVGAA